MSDRDYFNQRASEWDTLCIHNESKVNTIVELLQITPKYSILDVGTGTGILIPFLHRLIDHDGKICAIDVSENMLAEAEKKYAAPNVTYIHGDVLTTHLEQKFDLIICYSMFPHFKDNKVKAIETMRHMLNAGGKLCIAHSQSRDAINALHVKAGEAVKHDKLPEMAVLIKHFEDNELIVTHTIDNDAYYIIIGTVPE